jgi:cytochrome c biogenesis protein CcdA
MRVLSIFPILITTLNFLILLLNRVIFSIGLLWIQYVLAAVLMQPVQPVRTLVARLVGGTLICVILFSSERRFTTGLDAQERQSLPRSIWFKAIVALIFTLLGWAFAYQSQDSVESLQYYVRLGSILNIALGLVMLGLYQDAVEAAIGLLILLIGFDLFYSGIEPSLAILLLMLAIQVIIALATSYIMSIRHQSFLESSSIQ